MTIDSPLLSAIPGLRHAFFDRDGGVSEGIYASLNGGLGSRDEPSHVAENRRRMAAQLAVAPQQLLTAFQIHSPDVAVATEPWDSTSRPRADAIVTRAENLAIGVTTGMPLVVELGISFDVILAVLILGVLVQRIVDRFESMDVGRLSKLKG